MESIWSITINDYLEIIKRAKEAGLQAGDSMEEIFIKYMEEKGQQPCGHTELNKEELLNDLVQKNKSILDIVTNSRGEQTYKIIKKKDENLDEKSDFNF